MQEMTILAEATEVCFGGGLAGVVTAVPIRGGSVQYEVQWFANSAHHSAWLPEHMLKPKPEPRQVSLARGGHFRQGDVR